MKPSFAEHRFPSVLCPLKGAAFRPMRLPVSTALIDLSGELPAVRNEPTAARTGVWTIRPHQALRWARRSPTPGETESASAMPLIRALGVLGAVLAAGVLGGVGAWAFSS